MEKLSKLSRVLSRRVLFVSLIIFGLSTFSIMSVSSTTVSYDPPSYSSLTPHDPISICSNYGFTVFPGSGTEEEPYVIEGLEIITTDSSGIYITDTTKYFIVRNCYIEARYRGISISTVADGTATIINNTCSNCVFGIRLWRSSSSTVANNAFTNCGLYINEDTVDAYISYTVENNWVNGKKIGYYTNHDSTTIAEPIYGQLILINCTNVTVRDQILNNAGIGLSLYSCTYSTINNNTCNDNYYYGISLDSSSNSTVTKNTCNDNYSGIFLWSSGNFTVESNTCNNNKYGIFLWSSGNSTVESNTCNNNNDLGIYLLDSGSATVSSNTCENNGRSGIYLSHSGSSTVDNNACNNNYYTGIFLRSSGSSAGYDNTCNNNFHDGIALLYSGNSTVVNNTCSNNNVHGIKLFDSDFCVVTYNLLQENEGYGVYLNEENGFLEPSSDNCIIHHNTFVDNNIMRTSQAFDGGTNNTWYDTATLEGNYWSDWSGTGSYSIDVSAISIDPYPLDEPAEYSTVETQVFFTFILLIAVVPLLLTKLYSRKERKID